MPQKKTITIIGAGSFGTAVANVLCNNSNNKVYLWSNIKEEAEEIERTRINSAYFPNKILDPNLKAVFEKEYISKSDILMLIIPSAAIIDFIDENKEIIKPDTLIVNYAKGLLNGSKIITEVVEDKVPNDIVSIKGPSFAMEVINNAPTIFTLGFKKREHFDKITEAFENTNLFLDYSTDIRGVEILSVIKNIYAIVLGIFDAKYNSSNTRFMVMTKAFNEMKFILEAMGGKKDTINLACGFGDFGLTSLNDLSRNRTLGLLIGKNFFNTNLEGNNVVLEGVKAIKMVHSILSKKQLQYTPLLNKIANFFNDKNNNDFKINYNELFKVKMKTVLTYGTFDMLHYGQIEILRRARKLGDRLIVGLSTDDFNKEQGINCRLSYEKRKKMLEALKYVDVVIPEKNWQQKQTDINEYKVDTFVMDGKLRGKFDFLQKFCEIYYLPNVKMNFDY